MFPRSPQRQVWVFHKGNFPVICRLLSASICSFQLNKAWGLPYPPRLLGKVTPWLRAMVRSLLFWLRSKVLLPTPIPGTALTGTSLSLISVSTSRWLQADVCIPCCSPFRLRVSQYLGHTFPLDDTRPPWVTHVSSPPCRPHTPWYDGQEPIRLRHHSAGSTIVHLWPTGSSSGRLPSITTRWFSSSPSDPTSRWAPCPPILFYIGP